MSNIVLSEGESAHRSVFNVKTSSDAICILMSLVDFISENIGNCANEIYSNMNFIGSRGFKFNVIVKKIGMNELGFFRFYFQIENISRFGEIVWQLSVLTIKQRHTLWTITRICTHSSRLFTRSFLFFSNKNA